MDVKSMIMMCRACALRPLPWALALLALGAVALAACGSGDKAGVTPTPPATKAAPTETMTPVPPDPTATQTVAPAVEVDVFHGEWDLIPSVDVVPAGVVKFNATNDGAIPHNFRLAKTELAPEALPVDPATLLVKEEELVVVAQTDDILAGAAEEVIVTLEPGSYVLYCNVAGHYGAGLHAAFTVE